MSYQEDSDDQWQQQQDVLEREQRAMDCLTVCDKHGLEGTARELAALLGLSQQWKRAKEQHVQPRTASVG